MRKINENSKITLTVRQLKRLVKEANEDIVSVRFNRDGLIKLGFRKMYDPDDHLWADALPGALVFCNQYISVVCGDNNGNREVEVSQNTDNLSWKMINPTDENLIELFNTNHPERLLEDTTKFINL